MISIVALSNIKAAILEDVLGKLLENSGYRLITKATTENKKLYPEFLVRGNGLNISGRGGVHQADALGQFPITIPFNYPVRLFLEAKYFLKKIKSEFR